MCRMLRWCACLPLIALVLGACARAEPQAAPGWHWEVFATGLPRIDNLAGDASGRVYGTLERSRRRGALVEVRPGGRHRVVLGHLNRPDGLYIADGKGWVTEEVRDGRILEVDLESGAHRELARLDMPEGIRPHPAGGWYVSLDRRDGRILHLLPGRPPEIVYNDLNRPEGIDVAPDGGLLVAETGRDRVLVLSPRGRRVLVPGLQEPDQVARRPDSVWITEDADPGRLLRLGDGGLETVVSGLRSPQGMWFLGEDHLLVAEQGSGRILRVRRAPRGPRAKLPTQ